jgi:hypothetical protein
LILSRKTIDQSESRDSAHSFGPDRSSLITYCDEQKNRHKASLDDGCILKQQQRKNNSTSKKGTNLYYIKTLLERY